MFAVSGWTTLTVPLPWPNSTLLDEDVPAAVADLKEQRGGDLSIMGSATLINALLPHGLIDEYPLMIHPLVLGTGRRLFADAPRLAFDLVGTTVTTTGALITTYRPASGPGGQERADQRHFER